MAANSLDLIQGGDAVFQQGDLVARMQDEDTRVSGPYYVDNPDSYGGSTTDITVAHFAHLPGWVHNMPKNEAVVVGRVEPARPEDWLGSGFTLQALERFAPSIRAAKEEMYLAFPTFPDGRKVLPLVQLAEIANLKFGGGFIDDDSLDISLSKDPRGEVPLIEKELMAYAVPQPDRNIHVVTTGVRPRDRRIMKAYLPTPDSEGWGYGYFAVPLRRALDTPDS